MVHQGMNIICKECKKDYCVGCEELCPSCGAIDLADKETMKSRKRIQKYTREYHKNNKEQ